MKKWLIAAALSFSLITPSLAVHDSENNVPPTVETYKVLMLFGEIFDFIRRHHVDSQEDQKLIDEALKGMIKSLDKHSSYMTANEYRNMKESTSGRYQGIGAEVSWNKEKKALVIELPMEGSPAERDGLQIGDLVIEVDGITTKELGDIQAVINKIKGPEDTKVKLKILRKDVTSSLIITVTRGQIIQEVVKSRIVGDNIMYVKLNQFNMISTTKLTEAILALMLEIDEEKGLILDLRFNPGGLLNEAMSISDMFLDVGLIVEIRPRHVIDGEKTYATQGQAVPKNMPIIILINEFSASASEVVSGTLQDLERVLVLGSKSYGKGSVQSVIPLSNGGALRLTTAKYYTAGGTTPHGIGIKPDVEVKLSKEYWKTIKAADRRTVIDPQLEAAILIMGNIRNADCAFTVTEPDYKLDKVCPVTTPAVE